MFPGIYHFMKNRSQDDVTQRTENEDGTNVFEFLDDVTSVFPWHQGLCITVDTFGAIVVHFSVFERQPERVVFLLKDLPQSIPKHSDGVCR